MGVYFRGIQVLVAQDLLHRPHVHAVLQHQGGGGVAQLVGGILGAVQPRLGQVLFHQGVDHGAADPLVAGRQEQGIPVRPGNGPPHRQIVPQRVQARLVQVHHAHLVALAQDPQGILVNVRQVQPDELRNPQPAVEKQRQDAQIPLPVGPVHGFQQGNALIQRQIAGQGLFQLGRVDVLHRVAVQFVDLVAQIPIKGADGGQLPGPGGGVQSLGGPVAVGVKHPVPAEVGHVGVDFRQGHGAHEGQVHVPDVHGLHGLLLQRRIPGPFQIAEKIPQVQIIFVHRPLGVGLDGLMIRQEIQQNFRGILPVVHGFAPRFLWLNHTAFRPGCKPPTGSAPPAESPGS